MKRLHRLALADYAATRHRDRWRAKLSHDRVRKDGAAIPEPAAVGTTRKKYFQILEAYRDVRRPRPEADQVYKPDLPRGWRELAEKLAEVQEVGDRARAD